MAGRKDFSDISVSSLKHMSALLTLGRVRKQSGVSVELRQDGKTYVFFCILCHACCYSDKALDDHLRGRKHRGMLSFANLTLLLENQWPFNDGVFFFHDSDKQQGSRLALSNGSHVNGYGGGACGGGSSDLVIPGVLQNGEMSSLNVKLIGFGEIGARIHEKEDESEEISRIWCAWLGNKSFDDEDDAAKLPKLDFAVVNFPYDYNLGRQPLLVDFEQLCASETWLEESNTEGKSKRIKSISEPGDISASFTTFDDSTLEGYQSSGSLGSESLSAHQLPHSKSARRRIRQEMRQQQSLAAERTCNVCLIKILPGKDVACLLNTKTGRLACSSRNRTGAFHLFHTSCLVHWILFCIRETWRNHKTIEETPGPVRRRRGRRSAKKIAVKRVTPKILSIFCPECQGTGINTEERELEKPSFLLPEMFLYNANMKTAKKAWIKDPEILKNCSVGLHFPRQSEENEEQKEAQIKLLHFYRADVQK